MPMMGSTDIQFQLQKFTCEIKVEFLVTRIEITPCLLDMEFLYNFDYILNLRKNELFCGAIGKTFQLSPSQRSNKNLFLFAAEDHELPRRCEGFIECKFIDEEGNITQHTEIIVEPMKGFEDKSHSLIARSLNDMVNDVVWVRALNPTLEPKKVYKNARIACEENIEKISRVQQNNPDNNKKHRDEFDFEKHVNSSSMSLSCEEMTKVRSRNSNDMGFCDRIYHKIKLKKDAVPFRCTYGSMSFEKRKAMKKNVEELERDDLVEPTNSDWAAPSLLVPKKDGTYRVVVDYRGLNKQIEKTCWLLPRINQVMDSLEGNMYFSNIDLLSGYFQMALEEESQQLLLHLLAYISGRGSLWY